MVIDVHQSGVLLIALLAKILNLWHEKTCDMRQLGRIFKTQNLPSGRVSFMKIQPFVNDVAKNCPTQNISTCGFSLARSDNQSGMSQNMWHHSMIWTLIQVYHGLTDGFLFLKRFLLVFIMVFIMVCHIFSPSILGPTCRASSESSQPVGSHLVSIALHAMFEILGMAQRRLDTAGYPPNLYCVADCS